MKKFEKLICAWLDGKQARGFKGVSLETMREIIDIRDAVADGRKPEFINGEVKQILDKCGIETIERGVGWEIK